MGKKCNYNYFWVKIKIETLTKRLRNLFTVSANDDGILANVYILF